MANSAFDPSDTDAVRDRLLGLRAETERLIESSKDARSAVELDQSKVGRVSRMDALQGQQMALATDRRRLIELQKIDAALKRLDAGDYGYCVRCDEEIEVKRLAQDPAIPLCFDCASSA